MKKKNVILIIVAIALVATATVGVTYALWSQTHQQETDNVVKTGCFETTFTDVSGSEINLDKTLPMTDEKGLSTVPYQFTIKNTCSIGASYAINFEVDQTSTLPHKYLKVNLNNETPNTLDGLTIVEPQVVGNSSYQMFVGELAAKDEVSFDFRMWLSENALANEVSNTSLKGKIVVSSSPKEVAPFANKYIANLLADNPDTMNNDDPDGNIRYMGKNPNNYVNFNNELWRIIGTFNVLNPETNKTETRVKIIRDESIGNYSWDSSSSEVNGGWGVNEWSQADIMTTLNSGAYFNRTNGICYSGESNSTTPCDFSSNGLTTEAKALIDKARWNTGTVDGMTNTYTNTNVLTFYTNERSTNNGKICSGGTYCNDTVDRTTIWDGIVGLMYPSDYGYATSGGPTSNRNVCINSAIHNWDSESYKADCVDNSWMFNGDYQLTLTSVPYSLHSHDVFCVVHIGSVNDWFAYDLAGIRPVVYLKSDVKITGGSGTVADAYQLSL